MESIKNKTGNDSQEDQENRESLNERRLRNLENYNHNLASQMISLLTLMNYNIQSLTSKLKDRGLLVEEGGQNRYKAKSEDNKATINTLTSMDQGMEKVQDQMKKEQQKIIEAAQTMQEIEKITED